MFVLDLYISKMMKINVRQGIMTAKIPVLIQWAASDAHAPRKDTNYQTMGRHVKVQIPDCIHFCYIGLDHLIMTFFSYLSYYLYCCTLPDKRCLSHGKCL